MGVLLNSQVVIMMTTHRHMSVHLSGEYREKKKSENGKWVGNRKVHLVKGKHRTCEHTCALSGGSPNPLPDFRRAQERKKYTEEIENER